ncbi:craniofacial development protein 2-like [Macrobrachium nipponense]|uniref:craniofacial development protein 2-like n=1 Tax=Macrobrachium nipponense TaxID=159736 RepID=UPI0030C86C33
MDKGVIYYIGREDGRHEEGVGFYISKKINTAVVEFEGISSRIARIRMTAKWFKITVITLHAPTEDSEEDTKDRWYSEVQEVLNKVPGHDMLIILGDMNAKVGKEIAAFKGTMGTHSLHENSNDNGIRLATLATEYNLVVGGTLFPHKEKHKGTWLSPDGNTTNQIDHILVKRKFRSALMDVRAYQGADCDSDHYMVAAKIRIKLTTKRKNGNKIAISG